MAGTTRPEPAPGMMAFMDHPLDAAIALAPQADGTLLGHTHPAYANMVGPYGGITAAQALNAVLQSPARLGEPVALTVNFCAALADGAFTAQARAVRTNRSTQHWTVDLQQAGEVVATATVFTALRRDTWADDEHRMPEVPAPEDLPRARAAAPVACATRCGWWKARSRPPGTAPSTTTAPRACGCATTRRVCWTTPRWQRCATSSSLASGAAARRRCR